METLHHEIYSLATTYRDDEIIQWTAQRFFKLYDEVSKKKLTKREWQQSWKELRAAASMVRQAIVFQD